MKTQTLEFPFVSAKTLDSRLNTGKGQRVWIQRNLPSPLYWWKWPGQGGRKLFFNWVLIQDYLLHGDRPDHDRLIEAYLATLPKAS